MKLKLSKKDIKANRGITLIALVITIIVLLILAGVTIATLTGDNGILTKAGDARNTTQDAEIEEEIRVAWNKVYMDSYLDSNTNKATALQAELKGSVVTPNGDFLDITYKGKTLSINATTGAIKQPLPVITAGQKAPATSNAQYKSGNYTAIIPAGFTVSATESSIEHGLVVIDGSENEWVWIPVANVTDLYIENTTEIPWTMYETSGENAVVSRYASKSEILSGQTRTTPGDTSAYREPDVLNNDSYDKNTTNLSAAGLGANLSDMATKLRDDYKNMIDSVRKNGGFYVGRYELSNAGTKKSQPSLTNTNWYKLYAKCKTFGDESTTYSRMIWGCQWDQVCKFISTAKDANGKTISLTDSTKYGNYKNSRSPANKGNYEKQKKKNTGSNEAWKTNNIYDLAGNCTEWTQEASDTVYRAYRGGTSYDYGDDVPVTYRGYCNPTYTGGLLSSRPVLYIK